ncbi:MAG: AAA-like domain-containing protein [Prochloraceae cyanobacterium]
MKITVKEISHVDRLFKDKTGKQLNRLQIAILEGTYRGLKYRQIADNYGCSEKSVKNAASELWKTLSFLYSRSINKKNLTELLQQLYPTVKINLDVNKLEIPSGEVPLDSQFYVQYPVIENLASSIISKQGGLIRIKAPPKMGKSSLMRRILHLQAESHTQVLDLHLPDGETLQDLDKLLKWLCISVGIKLKLPNCIEEYWYEDLGSKPSCSFYFEEYLLEQIDRPLILAFDKLDYLFASAKVAADFFGLLRAWHEKAKNNPLWGKLRLILVYTENPLPLASDRSPFNVGETISLPKFTLDNILDLADKHGLNWQETQGVQLMNAVDGHPYLVRRALYDLVTQNLSLLEFLESFSSLEPYNQYLPK